MQVMHMLQSVIEHKHLYTNEYIFVNMWKYSSIQFKMRSEKSVYAPLRLSEVSPTLPLKNVNVSIHLRQTTWIRVYAIYMWIGYTLCRLLVYINSCKKNTYARYSSCHYGEVYVSDLLLTRMPGRVYVPCIYLHASGSYRRRLGSLLYLRDVFRVLINSLVCCLNMCSGPRPVSDSVLLCLHVDRYRLCLVMSVDRYRFCFVMSVDRYRFCLVMSVNRFRFCLVMSACRSFQILFCSVDCLRFRLVLSADCFRFRLVLSVDCFIFRLVLSVHCFIATVPAKGLPQCRKQRTQWKSRRALTLHFTDHNYMLNSS